MKQNKQPRMSGIRIENTISMAVQNRNHRRKLLHLVIIAFIGALGGIFTFLSMFQPQYHKPTMIVCFLIEFVVCTLLAIFSGKWQPLKVLPGAVFAILVTVLWKPFCSGFTYMVNTVYKAVYMTDWERFTISEQFTEEYSITVFLVLVSFLILYMLCYAVIHFQNFFLSLIATIPYVEIGFYFGMAANHMFAIMLLSFWFSMAAVHLSNFGAYHGKEKNSFLRRDNTFFPVSSMRFMVTEKIGISVLAAVLILCIIIQQILQMTDYKRSDEIKKMRGNVQEYISSMSLSDSDPFFDFLGFNRKTKKERIVAKLGQEDEREFQNISISGLTFSDLPEGRIYLKYLTGEVYGQNAWSMLEESVYENDVFTLFETLDYYPQDFLYENMKPGSWRSVTMTMRNLNQVISECVPYAYRKNNELKDLHDNDYTSFSDTYEILLNQNFEDFMLSNSNEVRYVGGGFFNECTPEHQDIFREITANNNISTLKITAPNTGNISPKAFESALLCRYGYRDFVMTHDTALPDTPAIQNVRNAYADLLAEFDVYSASASDTIAFLQVLREAVCENVTYTLAPGRTPSDKDFVEYFLLENRKGYCMHYATAGVILARMAGIPARYCEGYMVDCSTNPSLRKNILDGESVYTIDVLDSNAHAWVEFYVDGWGWIPMEFTYTSPEQEEPTEPVTEQPTITTTVTIPSVTMPSVITTDSQPVVPSVGNAEKNETNILPLLIVLGCFLLAGAILGMFHLMRKLSIQRRNRQFSQKDRTAAALCIYAYLLRLLSYCGVNTEAQRTAEIAKEGMEKCGKYLENCSLEDAVTVAAKAKFSNHVISPQELELLLTAAKALASSIYQDSSALERIKLKYFLHYV